jgi:hypothetical protein
VGAAGERGRPRPPGLLFFAFPHPTMTPAPRLLVLTLLGVLSLRNAVAQYYWIATTNQASHQIECYDPVNYGNWNTAGALKWSFKPTTTSGYSSTEISAWTRPSDVKLRSCSAYSGSLPNVFAACDSAGLATIATYPGKQRLWAKVVGGNPHAVEILPNGNIAIASSAGGWIRLYASSQGGSNGTYSQFNLDDAHGVLWDPSINRLWVVGQVPGGVYVLTALQDTGTAAAPNLVEDTSRHYNTPTGFTHDLAPNYFDTNLLWLTTNTHGYSFNKTTHAFTVLPGAADGSLIKGIGNQPAGQIVEARQTGGCYTWTTDTVLFYDINTGAQVATRQVDGACFYKARVWWWAYQ